jgi:hypothetical protein
MKTSEFEIRVIGARKIGADICLMLRLTTPLREKGWQYPIIIKERGRSFFNEVKKGEKLLIETFNKFKESLKK